MKYRFIWILVCAALAPVSVAKEPAPWLIEARQLPAPPGASSMLNDSIAGVRV